MSNTRHTAFDKEVILERIKGKFGLQLNADQVSAVKAIITSTSDFIEASLERGGKKATQPDADRFVYYLLLHILSVHNHVKAMPKIEEKN